METKTFEEWFMDTFNVDIEEVETASELEAIIEQLETPMTLEEVVESYSEACSENEWDYDVPEYADP